MLEPLVKRHDARFAHPCLHQRADGIVDHRRGNAGLQAEAVGQARGDVVLAAGDVNIDLARLAEWDDARIEAMNERSQGKKIQSARIAAQI